METESKNQWVLISDAEARLINKSEMKFRHLVFLLATFNM